MESSSLELTAKPQEPDPQLKNQLGNTEETKATEKPKETKETEKPKETKDTEETENPKETKEVPKSSRTDTKIFLKYEKLKLYAGKVINSENIMACIIFAMKLFRKSSMDGRTKKENVIKLIRSLIDEFATDDFVKTQFDANFIGFIIESVYFEFRTNFKTKKLCC